MDRWLVLCRGEPPPPPSWRGEVEGSWAVFPGSAANWSERTKRATEAWSPDVVLSDLLWDETENPFLRSWLKERDLVWLPTWGETTNLVRQTPLAVVIDAREADGFERVLCEALARANQGTLMTLESGADPRSLPVAAVLVVCARDPVVLGTAIRHAAATGSICIVFGTSPVAARRRICGAETATVELPGSGERIRETMCRLQQAVSAPAAGVAQLPPAAWLEWTRGWTSRGADSLETNGGVDPDTLLGWIGDPLRLEGAEAERWSTIRWMLADRRSHAPFSLRTLVGDELPARLVEFLRRPSGPAWLESFTRGAAAIPAWTERCEQAARDAEASPEIRADLLVRIAEGCFRGVAQGFAFDWRQGLLEKALRLVRDARALSGGSPRGEGLEVTLLAALGRFRESAEAAPGGSGAAEAGWSGLLRLMPGLEGHVPLPDHIGEIRTWVQSCFEKTLDTGAVDGTALHGLVLLAAYEGDVERAIAAAEMARARRGAALADLSLAAIHAWFAGDQATAKRCLAAEAEQSTWPVLQRAYFAEAHALFGDADHAIRLFRSLAADAATLFHRVEGPSFRWQVLAASLRALGEEQQAAGFAMAGRDLHPYGALRDARIAAVRPRVAGGPLPTFNPPIDRNRGYREPLRPPLAATKEHR
ncbi:MAG: hypothetical protein QM691_05645 [Opitutaceae bacterium]